MDRANSGLTGIHDNHFELNQTASVWVKSARNVSILDNVMYGPSTQDIVVSGAYSNSIIEGNLMNNGLTVEAGIGSVEYSRNHQLGAAPVIAPAAVDRVRGVRNVDDMGDVVWSHP